MVLTRRATTAAAVTLAAGLVTASAFQGGQTWPPPVQEMPKESPVLSPADSMKTMVLPPGYHLELVASEPMIQEPVAVGKESTPTPTGTYYTRVLLKAPDPNTVYGPYAYGLSGHSEVLTEFNGGDAELGIHGNKRHVLQPGESFQYPEFEGFFAGVRWARLDTIAGPLTIASGDPATFLRVGTPRSSHPTTSVDFPAGDLSFLHAIPGMGSKFKTAEVSGPSAQPAKATGSYKGTLVFFTGEAPR